MDRLRYSDRKQLAEKGSLGPPSFDVVPNGLKQALTSIYENAARKAPVGPTFDSHVVAACEQHFGRNFWGVNAHPGTGGRLQDFLRREHPPITPEALLDIVEILAEEGVKSWTYNTDHGQQTFVADAGIEDRINAAFVRHRFGFRLSNGQVHRIGSPALDVALVGPALLATAQPGWEQADRSYRDALQHQRGGAKERGAAITDAHAALEAALKASGFKGDTLAALAKDMRNSGVVHASLEGVPELLDKLLKRSQGIRDSLSDAHGRGPDATEVPAAVVDLAIHWTGAFIVYLAQSTR